VCKDGTCTVILICVHTHGDGESENNIYKACSKDLSLCTMFITYCYYFILYLINLLLKFGSVAVKALRC
jgi:hypothetical protein